MLTFAGFITAVAVGIGIAVWPQRATSTRTTGSRPVSATSALGGHSLLTHWGICWGGQAGSVQPTDVVTYQGSGTLQITVNKPSTAGFFATCTSHGLTTLHSGMKVTVYLRTPAAGPAVGGVNFWVYDSASNAVHAPETPKGVYEPLPATSGWEKYTWTVPAVDTVHSAGIEIDSTTDRPLIVWMSSFTW